MNRFPFVFLQAKEPAGDDKTVPDSVKSNLEEFTKEQIQVCSEEEVSMTQSQWDIPRIGELGIEVGRGVMTLKPPIIPCTFRLNPL